MKCGHASGVTYSGCMKCDLDRQAELIKELQASLKAGGEVSERQYQRIKELEARIELALRISSNPCMPGFVSPALRGMKEKDMPSSIQAMLKEDAKYEAAIGEHSDDA